MAKLYVIRHGKTDWNNQGILQGSTDIEMNEEGINQIYELSKNINLDDVDLCICSPMKRTKKTAEIIINNQKEIIYNDLLVERYYGDFEGKRCDFNLLKKHWDYYLNDEDGNIESLHKCLDRASIFIDYIKNNYPDKNILVVTHGSVLKALHYNINGYNKDTDFLSFNPQNGVVYTYELNN